MGCLNVESVAVSVELRVRTALAEDATMLSNWGPPNTVGDGWTPKHLPPKCGVPQRLSNSLLMSGKKKAVPRLALIERVADPTRSPVGVPTIVKVPARKRR